MTKSKKIAVSIISGFVGLILLQYLIACLFLTKPGMNGFAVANGMIRLLISGEEYAKIGEDRYIYRRGGLKEIVENEYDSYTFVDSYCDSVWGGKQPDLEEIYTVHPDMAESQVGRYGLVTKDGQLYRGRNFFMWTPPWLGKFISIHYMPFDET